MKKILFAICLFAAITLNAQTPVFDWVKKIGDSSSETGRGIARDASGNLYIAGSFMGTDDFDPGPGVANLTTAGGNDIFLAIRIRCRLKLCIRKKHGGNS